MTAPGSRKGAWPLVGGVFRVGSGPCVARAFHALLALVFLAAFASLGAQIDVLVGSDGLLPAAEFVARLRRSEVVWHAAPTLFWLGAGDAVLVAGIGSGLVLSLLALAGVWPRLCLAALVPLYLSYVTVCRDFLAFQWDNLLLEAAFLSLFLSRDRRAPWIHWLFRVLLFKLYFESGLAKWQSPIGDWADGSAMTFYYETAPLPTALAWYTHHLPEWWHHLESRVTLVAEMGLGLATLGPRPTRLAALVGLTGFQLVNAATANYGYFVYLTLALHVFLLDDADLGRAARALRRWRPFGWLARSRLGPAPPRPRALRLLETAVAALVVVAWLGASAVEGITFFGGSREFAERVRPLRAAWRPFHLASNYHLFASVTRERIEPDVQTYDASSGRWTSQALRHKPGPPERRPPLVAPHQPRVDFQLWFYGLAFRGGAPLYVERLVGSLCRAPETVQPLFAGPIPAAPDAVRIVFWRYRFSTPAERDETGAWWTRESVATSNPIRCSRVSQRRRPHGADPTA